MILFIVAYVAIAVLLVLPIARVTTHEMVGDNPEMADWMFGAFLGLFGAALWPFTLLMTFVAHLAKASSGGNGR